MQFHCTSIYFYEYVGQRSLNICNNIEISQDDVTRLFTLWDVILWLRFIAGYNAASL